MISPMLRRTPLGTQSPNTTAGRRTPGKLPALKPRNLLKPAAAAPASDAVAPSPAAKSFEVFGVSGVLASTRGATPAAFKSEGRAAARVWADEAEAEEQAPVTPGQDWTAEEWALWGTEAAPEEDESATLEAEQWTEAEWAAWEVEQAGEQAEWTAEECAEWGRQNAAAWAVEACENGSPVTALGVTGLLQTMRGRTPEAHKANGRANQPKEEQDTGTDLYFPAYMYI